jgi:enterochelin esterase-like enzyme
MIARVQIRGPRTGLTSSSGYVYLPPQYFQLAYSDARFPAVLALTGYPGGARSIIDRLGLPATAARLAAAGRARPVVYVMLNVSPVFPRDTECTNVPAGPQVASFFATDVPLAIEQTFRVTASHAGWGTLGYSTGGYCAAKLAMMYPDTFSAAVSIAGYYTALRDSTTGNLYGGSTAYQNENNLDWRLRHLPVPPVSVLVTSSKVSENTYPGTLGFLRLVRSPMHAYALIDPVGGHNFGVWSHELPSALQWLTYRLWHPRSASSPPSGTTARPAGASA